MKQLVLAVDVDGVLAVPVGDENEGRGQSTYNWIKYAIDLLKHGTQQASDTPVPPPACEGGAGEEKP